MVALNDKNVPAQRKLASILTQPASQRDGLAPNSIERRDPATEEALGSSGDNPQQPVALFIKATPPCEDVRRGPQGPSENESPTAS